MEFKFPKDFLWGAASSAMQIEAACDIDGKTQNVVDYYSRVYPEKFFNTTPDTAADFYHRYEEDIALMRELGLKTFRFTISWARIYSDVDSAVNEKGVAYYNRVIDCLIKNGIEPFFDLFHFDLPMFVAEKGGPKNPLFPKWFARYARTCFERFGDRVKLWCTVNEPTYTVYGAYAYAHSGPFESDIKGAFLSCHNMLLAHFKAVKIYHEMNQGGRICAVNAFSPAYPRTLDAKDIDAAERNLLFSAGWWLDPMMKGHYPKKLTSIPYIAENMPENYEKDIAEAFEKMDFLGINYYSPANVEHADDGKLGCSSYEDPSLPADDFGFTQYPPGLFDAMMYLKDTYGSPEIYITENGTGVAARKDKTEDLNDEYRVRHLREHVREVARSIRAGADIKGYYVWTFIDTYEINDSAYNNVFGLVQVDWDTLKRTPRKSFYYYQNIIKNNTVE